MMGGSGGGGQLCPHYSSHPTVQCTLLEVELLKCKCSFKFHPTQVKLIFAHWRDSRADCLATWKGPFTVRG